jgi:hypothetical protein
MDQLPAYTRNFVAVSAFEAIYRTEQDEQTLIWESRISPDRKATLFTRIGNKEIRVGSIHEFVLEDSRCISMTVPHKVRVVWNGSPTAAELLEVFIPAPSDKLAPVHIKVSLTIGDASYESVECDSLTEAVWELDEMIGPTVEWSLQTCFDCIFSWPAFLGPTSERDELRCYRDAPEAFEEIRAKSKFASQKAREAGHYFVNAFHTCAGWKSLKASST